MPAVHSARRLRRFPPPAWCAAGWLIEDAQRAPGPHTKRPPARIANHKRARCTASGHSGTASLQQGNPRPAKRSWQSRHGTLASLMTVS